VSRLVVVSALLLTPIRILGHGFFPSDDALRHAAKAVSGRPWSDVLLLAEGAAEDLHPGWHALLSAVHRVASLDAHALVLFSVVFAFAAFAMPWVLMRRRPEAILFGLLVANLMAPQDFGRFFVGRPFLLTAAALNALLLALPKLQDSIALPRRTLLAITFLVALAVWMHPSFYLWGLPILSCALARHWRAAARAVLAVSAGALLGGVFAGRPLGLIVQNLRHGWTTADLSAPASLAAELRPHLPPPGILVTVVLLLIVRALQRRSLRAGIDAPVGWLTVSGWLLGFVSGRFWYDFGMLGFIHLVSQEAEVVLPSPGAAARRLGAVSLASAVFVLVVGADTDGRWARPHDLKWVALFDPTHRPAFPDPGGLLYADSMDFFFQGFYRQPDAPWRYVVGFEQSIMPPEDRRVLRALMASRPLRPGHLFEPWIRRMRPEDRLLLEGQGAHDRPQLRDLEWTFVPPTFWSGRKPASLSSTLPQPPSIPD
jgi:hypothetical protein